MPDLVRRCRPLLGTLVEIEAPPSTIDAAFAAVAGVHALMSFHDEASDLARLRRALPGQRVAVSEETVDVLRLALDLHVATAGLFDVAIASQLVLAGFLPKPPDLDVHLFTGTAADIEIEDDSHVRCHRPVLIDLGGIAKGWAVDRAIDVMAASGAGGAFVNAGGDLRAIGDLPHTVHVRTSCGRAIAVVEVRDTAIATSDNLSDRIQSDLQLMTPHIGRHRRPVVADACVSVVADRCAIADAFTKIAIAEPALAERLAPSFGVRQVERFPVAQVA